MNTDNYYVGTKHNYDKNLKNIANKMEVFYIFKMIKWPVEYIGEKKNNISVLYTYIYIFFVFNNIIWLFFTYVFKHYKLISKT